MGIPHLVACQLPKFDGQSYVLIRCKWSSLAVFGAWKGDVSHAGGIQVCFLKREPFGAAARSS